MHNSLVFLLFLLLANFSDAQEISEWRGPNRTGVYNETGLLKEWPENGPELIWSIDNGLPTGYSSVSISNETIYLTGNIDNEDVLIAINLTGTIKWQTVYGKSWEDSFEGSRSTPTVEGESVFVTSGSGEVVCIDAVSGKINWKINGMEKFLGDYHKWGISESLLLFENKVFFSPGGDETMMVALNKINGETIWKSKSLNEKPSYVSPILIDRGGTKQIISISNYTVFGISPYNGEIFWTFDFGKYTPERGRNNQTNSPLYYDGKIYLTSGYDHQSVMLNLSEDAKSVSVSWVDETLDVHHGGVVKVGNYIYGANWLHNRMGNWTCLDWKTGKVMYETEWKNKGSIISADDMLYCYAEKYGEIGIAKATPDKFKIISSFKITKGKGPHWSHPVIHNGILYVRHADALMAYKIKED